MVRHTKNATGFTLIELVVVIAILGILAVVALPGVGGVTSDAKTAADVSSLTIYNTALELYIAETGDMNLEALNTENALALLTDLQNRKYLKTLPDDPTVLNTGSLEFSGKTFVIH